MIFIKKMCVLRQMRSGFSGDGKQVGGVVKAEQYGKNLSIEISVVGFAPLAAGEYYALIADPFDRVELLPLRGKSLFNLISELDVSEGFCAVICLVKNGITPLAYGISGNRQYDFDKLMQSVAAPKDKGDFRIAVTQAAQSGEEPIEKNAEEILNKKAEENGEKNPDVNEAKNAYNDETIAEKNYYSVGQNETDVFKTDKEEKDERCQTIERYEDAGVANPRETEEKNERTTSAEDEDAENVRHPFNGKSEAYYRSVKDEIDELFKKYEPDETLSSAFPFSKWARVKEADKTEYLVGVIYEEAAPLYICYAFPAENKDEPPEDIAETCAFVPLSPFADADGCFVIFQSAATGECVKLKEA